ncbi:hypothetical protein ABDI30_14700 [Paenibacillus cisolokensis]|uniref:hypothetical protein n=1 Tax=Paenibacillus cisolokensis TaxID=1658519 RepID=UPI003D2DCC8B
MFRNLALILFGAFALFFLADFLVVYNAHIKIEKAVEQALDGAIIVGVQEPENQRGRLEMNESVAKGTVQSILKTNLKLNADLTNDHFLNSDLRTFVTYLGTVPRIEAEFDTEVKLFAGRMFGLDAYPLTIKRHTPYLGEFK